MGAHLHVHQRTSTKRMCLIAYKSSESSGEHAHCAVLSEPSLLIHTKYGYRERYRPKFWLLAPLVSWVCDPDKQKLKRKTWNILLSISFNISFEYLQLMFWPRNRKLNFTRSYLKGERSDTGIIKYETKLTPYVLSMRAQNYNAALKLSTTL